MSRRYVPSTPSAPARLVTAGANHVGLLVGVLALAQLRLLAVAAAGSQPLLTVLVRPSSSRSQPPHLCSLRDHTRRGTDLASVPCARPTTRRSACTRSTAWSLPSGSSVCAAASCPWRCSAGCGTSCTRAARHLACTTRCGLRVALAWAGLPIAGCSCTRAPAPAASWCALRLLSCRQPCPCDADEVTHARMARNAHITWMFRSRTGCARWWPACSSAHEPTQPSPTHPWCVSRVPPRSRSS